MTTPKLGMPELSVSQASKEITHNQALAIVDQVSQLTVVSRTNTPPGSPADGAAYIVTATATGAWAGKEGQIAYWLTAVAAWQFIIPANGWLAWSNADSKTYRREAGAWVELSTGGGGVALAQVVAFAGTSKTLAITDINTIVDCTSSSAVTITIPPQSSVTWTADAEIHVRMSGTGQVSIAVGSGVTIPPLAAPVLLSGQGAIVTLKRRSADVWALVGAIQGDQTITGNLNFAGNGRRLSALMDGSANAFAVQNNVANGATVLDVVPNGTATSAQLKVHNKSDRTGQFFQLTANNAGLGIFSAGTSPLPLSLFIGLSASWNVDNASPYAFRPGADNTQPLGTASFRASVIYAGSGTINTSDAREKTEVRALTAAEIEASKQLAKEVGAYRFLSAVAEKGDGAREHIGMTVQRAIEVMQQHGLEPFGYGFICFDSWGELPELTEEKVLGVVTDADGIALAYDVPDPGEELPDGAVWTETSRETAVVRPFRAAGDRYSFRPDELLLFIARGFDARLSALENA